jgi:putative two-component system response regulator
MSEEKKYTILIVDDEPTNVAVLNAILRNSYKVKAALNGLDAIKIARTHPQPDLILLDVIMDKTDGFEVCETLKADKETKHIPIVFVTALNESKCDKKGIEIGAIDFFSKPYSAPIILRRIENHLSSLQKSRDLQKLLEKRGATV